MERQKYRKDKTYKKTRKNHKCKSNLISNHIKYKWTKLFSSMVETDQMDKEA